MVYLYQKLNQCAGLSKETVGRICLLLGIGIWFLGGSLAAGLLALAVQSPYVMELALTAGSVAGLGFGYVAGSLQILREF